jgi:hypothetical protein
MESQQELIAERWQDGRGFASSPGQQPGLQGTEMWLAVLYYAADAIEAAADLGYSPRGVHHPGRPVTAATRQMPPPVLAARASLPLPGQSGSSRFRFC